jgi:hypothetical protein
MMLSPGDGTHVLLQADVRACLDNQGCYDPGALHTNAPLLVSFHPYGTGKVIFTSFHFETVSTDTVLGLLRYLIFLL